MIVAFGFTGVSTSLTVMSDIEVLDITTWSWTSVYTPSIGYSGIGGNNGDRSGAPDGGENELGSNQRRHEPSSPSVAIIAGAVTGGLVVFVLILVTFYLINKYHKQKRQSHGHNEKNANGSVFSSDDDTSEMTASVLHGQHFHDVLFKEPRSSTEPFEYNSSRRPSAQTHPLQQLNPKRSDTIGTSTTLVPSPWASTSLATSSVKRAASTPTHCHHYPIQSISAAISKPDDKYYGVRRAVTLSESVSSNTNNSDGTERTKSIPLVQEEEDDGFDRQEFILRSDEVSMKEILEDLEENQT
jgi:hypothetical protein